MSEDNIFNNDEYEEFRKYAEKVFPFRVDRTWDNVDDWIKYGDFFIKLRLPEETPPKRIGWSGCEI